jgi:glutamyl-tRNA(gln) and/or aspartyl-tRNA(asn) amidotransferase, A subunit
MKSLNVVSGLSMEIIDGIDSSLTNGIVRGSLAIKEHKEALTKKSLNFGIAVGVKLAVNSIAPDSSIANIGANIGLAITGVSLASEVKSTLNTALNFTEDEINEEITRLSSKELKLFD